MVIRAIIAYTMKWNAIMRDNYHYRNYNSTTHFTDHFHYFTITTTAPHALIFKGSYYYLCNAKLYSLTIETLLMSMKSASVYFIIV